MSTSKYGFLAFLVLSACGGSLSDDERIESEDESSSADTGVLATGEFGVEELALTASQVTWPATAPGENNNTVVALQYLLRNANQTLSVDGSFGQGTLAALQSFQRANALTVTSSVNVATWTKLIVTLQSGSENNAVRAAQHLLKTQHGANLSVTGLVGPTTLSAITVFQSSKCLDGDGTVGFFTWNALLANTSHCGSNGAAQRILGAHDQQRITLWDQTFSRFDGADPLNNIKDAAAGRKAKQSCHGTAPCGSVNVQPGLLNAVDILVNQKGYRVFVTTIVGGSHSANSFHYAGRAIDIDEVNGVKILGRSATARDFVAQCRALGAIEAFGPDNDPAGHNDHIHCAF